MYKKIIAEHRTEMLEDISKLVAHESVSDMASAKNGAPFGKGVRACMDTYMDIAKRLGFEIQDFDGYAISAQLGTPEEHLGILAHLDVVEANEKDWDSDPFVMEIRDNMMYGRGVNDDKGPLIAALYAAKFVIDQNPKLKRSIRVIVGGAEETTWECMDYYFKSNPQPALGFSPDGNFPIVNGEMGILQLSLKFSEETPHTFISVPKHNFMCHKLQFDDKTYRGDKHLSRNPQRGKNAIDSFIDDNYECDLNVVRFIKKYLYKDYMGKHLGLVQTHEAMNDLGICMMSLNSHDGVQELCLDIRYPISIDSDTILHRFEAFMGTYDFNVSIIKSIKPLYVNENTELIDGLKKAYHSVMNEEAKVITKGGASYARVLEHGVAFGATFEGEDPQPHMANEKMPVDSLLKACEIYCHAIENLIKSR